MTISIRRAKEKDTDQILSLLHQVLDLHEELRPDLYIAGTTKYSREELLHLFADDETPVLVACDANDTVRGYAFCKFETWPFETELGDIKTLYLDDLCVAENCRREHIGKTLYFAVLDLAKQSGCYNVTLNVWEGNEKARAFYEKMGMFVRKTQMETIL